MTIDLCCLVCEQDSGTNVVCPACRPHLNDNQKQRAMRLWHRLVVDLANCSCETCGHSATFDSGELCGDHLETQGASPDLRYDVSNGKCTCLPCHNLRHALPQSSMTNQDDKKPKAPKKKFCSEPHCMLLPLSNGKCIRHQPKR